MQESMIERLRITLRPFLHHGLHAVLDVETETARAVLAAMREPTDIMVDAGFDAELDEDGDMAPRTVWEAMIDKALAGES